MPVLPWVPVSRESRARRVGGMPPEMGAGRGETASSPLRSGRDTAVGGGMRARHHDPNQACTGMRRTPPLVVGGQDGIPVLVGDCAAGSGLGQIVQAWRDVCGEGCVRGSRGAPTLNK
jgi:hypothetical protein